jgi:hypothetical protein
VLCNCVNSSSRKIPETKLAKSGNASIDFLEKFKERKKDPVPQKARKHKHKFLLVV